MKRQRILLAIGLLAATLLAASSLSYGQPRVGGARVAGGSIRGGAAVGPYGGAGAAVHSRGTVIGPAGGVTTGSAGRGTVVTPGGSTINYGGAGRVTTGPGGVTAGRGVGGVQVNTPGGQTYTKVGRAGGAVGPGGNAVGGKSSIAVGTGPAGSAAKISHGGVAIGPGGAVGGKTTVGRATGPGGTVVGASRTGVAVNPYGLSGYTTRGVAVGHTTRFVAAGTLPAQGVYVRRNFVHYNSFSPTWYVAHPHAWRAAAWTAATFWTGVAWGRVSTTCGYPTQPIVYDYGTTIVYEGDQVYYNGEPVATAAEYTEQAAHIAELGETARVAEKDEWIPLGVFGMIQGEEKDANTIFQLAINKDGVIRGNYYDALSDTTLPVYGSVDKRTQRAAWTVGERKETVYETGVGNLTEDETTMLVHFGKDRTQQWSLIRLEKPEEEK